MFLSDSPVTANANPVGRWRRPMCQSAVLLVAGLFTLSIGPPAVGAAGTPSQTSFTFTGTVKGTLATANTPCSEQVVTAKGATFMLTGMLRGRRPHSGRSNSMHRKPGPRRILARKMVRVRTSH